MKPSPSLTRFVCGISLVCGLLSPCSAAGAEAGAGDEMVANGGFEGDHTGLAPGWVANCYGENDYRFERSTAEPREGLACQRIVCTRWDGGGVQFLAPNLSIEQGRTYTITLWVRGEIKGPLFCGFRQRPGPYTGYLVRYLRVGPQWRRYAIVGEASGTDPGCGLFFMYGSEGWLEVDGVSARPGAFPLQTAAIDAPAVKGNRVYNGSFELGTDGWAPLQAAMTVVEGEAPAGERHLSVAGGRLEGRPFVTTPGQIYTISAWLRRPAGPATVQLELTEATDGGGDNPVVRATLGTTAELGAQWQRVQATGVWDPGFTSGGMPLVRVEPGGFEVDAVQVEEGGLTAYAAARPVELAARLPAEERYPAPGQALEFEVCAAGEEPLPAQLRLELRVLDLWDRVRSRATPVLQTGGGRVATGRLSVTPPDLGLYRVEVHAADLPSTPGELLLGVLPPLAAAPRSRDAFFGVHAPPSLDPASPDLAVRISARAGCNLHRIHDFANWVQWYWVEPRPGERRWADAEVDHMLAAGYGLLGCLARTPPWAAKDPDSARDDWTPSPPRDMEALARYVRDVVGHYKDRVHAWEIWNEPFGSGFFAGTPEEYGEVLKVMSAACKEADPACTVVGVCAYPGLPDWIERVLEAAGSEHFDVLSYHRYFTPGDTRERDGQPPLVVRDTVVLQELLRRYGGERPLWQTEGGVACPTFYSWLPRDGYPNTPREAAATVAKVVTLLRSAGVEHWYYYYAGYAWGGRGDLYTLGNAPYILLDYDGSPKATLMALAAAAARLADARYLGKVAAGALRAYRFQRDDRQVAVVWLEGETEPFAARLPTGATAHDVMGAELAGGRVALDSDPVYLEAPELSEAVLASLAP